MKILILFSIISMALAKTCPSTIPVERGEGFDATCNITIHPTGNLGDPPCYYPECNEGKTAVCGCVDFSLFGGDGMFWACLHSGCECPTNINEHSVCGIHGSDFTNTSFVGTAPVAGNGCILGNRVGCLCKPVLGNSEYVEDWTWQCKGDLEENGAKSLGFGLGILLLGYMIV